MKLYKNRRLTLLDPFHRIMIPYCLGNFITEHNHDGDPNCTYHSANPDMILAKNKITIYFPACKIIFQSVDLFSIAKIKSINLISYHINPFSHHRDAMQSCSRKDSIAIKRKEVPIGKLRVHYFKQIKNEV